MCNSRLVASTGIPQTARQASHFTTAALGKVIDEKAQKDSKSRVYDVYESMSGFFRHVFSISSAIFSHFNPVFPLPRCISVSFQVFSGHCSTSATSGAFTVPAVPTVPGVSAVPEPLFGAGLPGIGHVGSKERRASNFGENK